ncbi:MAG: RHS repeat-associated core domain-containing protein, partial [Candidatus Electrothrix sp. EH2]|nr:RHS repeat-associated core domain-containing protein [Candidatus Electrothrix sp. EH2]
GQHTDYYRGAGGHLALMHQSKGGTQEQMYWYHYNNKGDVAGLTKQNGNSHHTYRYDPYGAVLPENGNFTDPHNHYTLTGKEFDEHTGLVWFGARHYDPETGVWMGQDTYRGRLNDPASLHRFMYVGDNPVNLYDSYGYSSRNSYDKTQCSSEFLSMYSEFLSMYDNTLGLVTNVLVDLPKHVTGSMAYRRYLTTGGINKIGTHQGMVKNLRMRKLYSFFDDTSSFMNDVSEKLGWIVYGADMGSSIFQSVDKIQSGEGSVSGQALYTVYNAIRKVPVANIVNDATEIVDFIGAPIARKLGSEIELDITGTMDKMIEGADPVVRENRLDRMFDRLSEHDIKCMADRHYCNMNWFEHNLWTLGEIYRD